MIGKVRKMRTALLADELVKRGHSVHWWASAFEHQRKSWICNNNKKFTINNLYTIHALRGCGYKKNISVTRYIDHYLIASKFRKQSREELPPDLIVASMPCHLLAYEGVHFAKQRGIPVIIDIRDLWPDIFLKPFKKGFSEIIARMALSIDFKKSFDTMHRADALLAVSEGYLSWGLDRAQRSATARDKTFLMGYKANPSKVQSKTEHLRLKERYQALNGKKIILFIGTFGLSYEIELLVEAANHMTYIGRHDAMFLIVGTGEKFEKIRRSAATLKNVMLPGWVDADTIQCFLQKAHVGIVPCRSVDDTLPNKPFEYMSAGLPLISSLEGEMTRIVDTHKIGLNYAPGDAISLIQCIEYLLDNNKLRDEMAQNARNYFNHHGCAEIIYSKYANHLENIINSNDR
ncbi:glycosyltransferase family 4 protein [Thermodesulfobacteriota bacterium]